MENKIININSIFRDTTKYPNPTHFKMTLPEKIRNVGYIKVTSMEIGNVHPTFNDSRNNNTFKIISGVNTDIVNLGNGNITSSIFLTVVQDIFDDINTSRGLDLLIDIDVVSGKLLITCSTSITVDFSRTGNSEYESIKYYLGFEQDTYTGTSISAESILNLGGVNYYFLRLNNMDNLIDHRVPNVFLKIVNDVEKFNTVYSKGQEYNSKDYVFRSPEDIYEFEVELVDYLGNTLDFKKFDFSFTIEVGYIYDINLYKKINNSGVPDGDTRLKYYY